MLLELGQIALLIVEEEPRQDLELVQTLLLQMEELTVLETALKQEAAILKHVQVWIDIKTVATIAIE